MDALDALLGRTTVSPALMRGPGPDEKDLWHILAAGAAAPDHGRLRPWRFLVVRGEARARLGLVFAAALARRHPEAPAEELAKERARAERAPLVIAVIARIEANHHKIPAIEQVCSAAAAAQNMLLAAHAQGYAAKWSTGANAYDPDVQAALGLGKDDRLIALLSIGHLAGPPPSPRRDDPAEHGRDWLGPGETRPLARA